MDRRNFLRLVLAGAGGAAFSACSLASSPLATPDRATPGAPTPAGSTPAAMPRGDVPLGTILSNENVPGFYVRFYRPFRSLDPGRWQLAIKGLVDAPTTLTLAHIQANLPLVEQNTRMACVEGWSSRALWGGFTHGALADLVKPQAAATHVYFSCEDEYYEVLPISELRKAGALFVTHMDGRLIGAKYGAPLRMIIPWLYGYKGAKTVNTLEFRSQAGNGFWSDVGPYTVEGDVLAGRDMPLDLGGALRLIKGGEITEY